MKKFFLVVALIAALAPALFVLRQVGGLQAWQGVLPEGVTDSLYYYARIHEVSDGHPLIGNPYVFEYRNTFAPAFFLPDIIAAVPVLIGLPFVLAMILNVFIWSFVFLWLAFKLFKLLRVPKRQALVWSVMAYLSAYSFMLRPVVMQIIYPLFLLFLVTLLKFLHEPLNRRRVYFLALTAAASFYAYTYLAYIVILVFVFVFGWFLFAKRFQELRSLSLAGAFTALLLVPYGLYTLVQVESPYYFETLTRLGLLHTHRPVAEAFFYGRWVGLGLIVFGLLWKFFPKIGGDDQPRKIFWFATGASLLVGLFLNVFTGVELSLAIHIGRFVLVWMALAFGAGISEWFVARTLSVSRRKLAITGLALIILLVGVARNVPRELVFFNFSNRGEDLADKQAYAAPLKWLNDNVQAESVIWADDSISEYLPILTRHYPLFAPSTNLHNIPEAELKEREQLSHSSFTLKSPDLKKFQVKYLLIDRAHDNPLKIPTAKALYDDGRFLILSATE